MKNIRLLKKICTTVIILSLPFVAMAQPGTKKISLKDSLDGSLDLSDYIIHANGVVPVPIIITEPALGGFGVGIIPVFLKKRPAYIDSVNGKIITTPVAPDITGGIGIYTINGTWLTAGFRQGTLIKSRIKYIIGAGYANVNMSFYKPFLQQGEKEFEFNIKTVPAFLQAIKRIGFSHWYAGFNYLFLKTDLNYTGDSLLPGDFAEPKEYSSIVSQLGAVVELDARDNIFSPDNGIKFHIEGIRSDNIFGSDLDYWRLNYYSYAYKMFAKKLVAGFRIDGQQTFEDPPFFMLPYISMRGIPAYRYQGKASILTEAEFRWDFTKRWSAMFYSGMGKAFDKWSAFGDAELVYSYGTGFRYLIARKFKLRMGLDLARGPEDFAYYIVFGSSWLK